MRVAVLVLLDFECLSSLLQHNGDFHVHGLVVLPCAEVILSLDVLPCKRAHAESALKVHKGNAVTRAIINEHGWHTGIFGHAGVVRTEGWCRMHNARAVFCGDEIAWNDLESQVGIVHGDCPIQQGLVAHADQFTTLEGTNHGVIGGFFVPKLLPHQSLRQNDVTGSLRVTVGGLHHGVHNVRTNGQCRVGGQGPWGGRPSEKIHGQPVISQSNLREQCGTRFIQCMKLCDDGRVLDVAVCAGLIELVRTQPCSSHRTVWLDGVALVQHPLGMQLGQQPPHRFHVFGVVGDVGCVHVHPIPHLTGQLVPFRRVTHDCLPAGVVVFFHGELGSNVLLGDPKLLLHPEFDG